jgi:hypothetical protein
VKQFVQRATWLLGLRQASPAKNSQRVKASTSLDDSSGSRPWKNASYDVGDALSFLAVTVEAPVGIGSSA